MRAVPIGQVLRVRFLKKKKTPVLEKRLRRAMEVLASTHDTPEERCHLGFNGDGTRNVRSAYVWRNPI